MSLRHAGAKFATVLILVLLLPAITPGANAAPLYNLTNFGIALPSPETQGIDAAGDVLLSGSGNYNGVYHSYGPSAGQITPASAYGLTPSGANQSGGSSVINGVVDSGTVFGAMPVGNSPQNAVISSDGQVTALGLLPGYTASTPVGANSSGTVTGYDMANNGQSTQAFVYQGGQMTPLGAPGPYGPMPTAINNSNQIVGLFNPSATSPPHAFLYQNGTMTDLGTLGGTQSIASGINDQGQIVGSSTLTNTLTQHAFLYSNGKMQDLGTLPGGSNSEATAINNNSQIVGDSDGHAVLWQNGTIYDLNSLLKTPAPMTLTYATGINDNGQITGWGLSPTGAWMGFLLTPDNLPAPAYIPPDVGPATVPEPSTLAIWGAIGVVAALRGCLPIWSGRPRKGSR